MEIDCLNSRPPLNWVVYVPLWAATTQLSFVSLFWRPTPLQGVRRFLHRFGGINTALSGIWSLLRHAFLRMQSRDRARPFGRNEGLGVLHPLPPRNYLRGGERLTFSAVFGGVGLDEDPFLGSSSSSEDESSSSVFLPLALLRARKYLSLALSSARTR